MITKTEAIRSLAPGAKFTNVHGVITWYSDGITQPSDSDLDAEIVRLQAEHDSQEYARNRATAYASTGDQLDMQYWDSVNDTTTWKDHIVSVKEQFPKV